MLFLTAFGIKAGLFPLFFWLPASYHTPPAAVGALLAGLLTKVGVYAMIRVFTLLFPDPDAAVYRVLLVLSAITMVVGLIGALAQRDFRRVLSFNLVGHIGFTTVGLALWTPASLGGSILYVLHHMLVISTLFLMSGLFLRQRRTTDLSALGGLYRSQPAVACLALVPLFSLAGVPPLSGFVAKVAVVAPMLGAGQYWLAAVALCVSLLTLLSVARLWEEGFWKPAPAPSSSSGAPHRLGMPIVAPIVFLVALTLTLTALAGPLSNLTTRAAEQLLDRNAYVRAVLGEEAPRAAR
jgi:multicomponent Na+:H+ antiporter subunit D